MRSRSPELVVSLALCVLCACSARGTASPSTPLTTRPYAVPPPELPLGSLLLTGDLVALRGQRPVHFLLLADDIAKMERDLAPVHPEAKLEAGAILVGRGVLPEAVEARHRAPSFLVDSDEPIIAELAASLPAEKSPATVRALVRGHFQTRKYGEFWTASRAAKLRSGDCSEHAVLVAAVARRVGIPARVVVGWVTITDERMGAAMGHAWAQLHDGARWVDVDATPLGDSTAPADLASGRSYIIAGELRDEGPSYVISLFNALSMLRATAITVVSD
jgi:hypothetical protein